MSEFATPGKIPPVISSTATNRRPPIEEWNPDGDIHVPLIGTDALYVPTIVRAPPQLPRPEQHPKYEEFEARGYEAFFTPANQGLPGRQLSFTAHSVQVDNYSNQWIWVAAARRWIPPSSVGWVLLIIPGTSTALWTPQAPGSHAQGTVGAATDPVVTVWHEPWLSASAGLILTV